MRIETAPPSISTQSVSASFRNHSHTSRERLPRRDQAGPISKGCTFLLHDFHRCLMSPDNHEEPQSLSQREDRPVFLCQLCKFERRTGVLCENRWLTGLKEHIYRDWRNGVPNSQCPEGPGGIGNPFLGPTMRWTYTHELSSVAAIHASDMETQPESSRGMSEKDREQRSTVRKAGYLSMGRPPTAGLVLSPDGAPSLV